MKSQNLHALIIGGGIAGPALALLLKKAGMSSAVYEAINASRISEVDSRLLRTA